MKDFISSQYSRFGVLPSVIHTYSVLSQLFRHACQLRCPESVKDTTGIHLPPSRVKFNSFDLYRNSRASAISWFVKPAQMFL